LTPANAGSVNQELYQKRRKKEKDFLKIIFLSRISPKKNLDGTLRILEKVKGHVEMNIYGPVTDETYQSGHQYLSATRRRGGILRNARRGGICLYQMMKKLLMSYNMSYNFVVP